MNPLSHAMLSWLAAEQYLNERRDRMIATGAGLIPDIDGFGALVDLARGDELMTYYNRYHHMFGHGLPFALAVSLAAFGLARDKFRTFLAVFCIFHLHLFCDLVGSRGPNGIWTLPWLMPFSEHWTFSLAWQWPLNGWQNILIGALAMVFILRVSWLRGRSILELISPRADAQVSATLRQRFGQPGDSVQRKIGESETAQKID